MTMASSSPNFPIVPPAPLAPKVPPSGFPPSAVHSSPPPPDGLPPSISSSASPNIPSAPTEAQRSVGMIFPPADLRSIIDKTAQFVSKNGPEFESRVLKEQKNMRFAFLYPNNPYRPYYEMKVQEFKTGIVGASQPSVPQAIADMRKKEEEKKKKKKELLMLTSYSSIDADFTNEDKYATSEPLKPPQNQFIIKHPFVTSLDADIIKTTAQFVARNGNRFIIGLSQREKNNPQFDFIKPNHILFNYFSSLIDSYTKCLLPEGSQIQTLRNICANYLDPLSRAHVKCLYNLEDERKKKEKEDKEAEEKMQLAQIDWHDFVVVETLDFTAEDQNLPLSPPVDFSVQKPKMPISLLSKSAAQNADNNDDELEKNKLIDLMKGTEDMELDMEEDMELDEERIMPENLAKKPQQENEKQSEEASKDSAAASKEVKVVKGYVRTKKRTAATGAAGGAEMQKCPITGKLIPSSDMSRHLKVLLLDPKWKQQKDRFLEKARKESAFAPLQDVEGNLASFVARRPDLFGSVEDEILEHSSVLESNTYSLSSLPSSLSCSSSQFISSYDSLTNASIQASMLANNPSFISPPLPFGISPFPAGNIPQPAGVPPIPVGITATAAPPIAAPPIAAPPIAAPPITAPPVPTIPPLIAPPIPVHLSAPPPPPQENLIPEAQFIQSHPEEVEFKVVILNAADGETEDISVEATASDYIDVFKNKILSKSKKFPNIKNAKQIILKDRKNNAILQDAKSLGYYNLEAKNEFELFFML